MNWSWSTALGGVKVQVPRIIEGDARPIEQLCREGKYVAELQASISDLDEIRCRVCGANEFMKRRSVPQLAMSVVLSFATGIVVPPWNWIRFCKNCGAKFKPPTRSLVSEFDHSGTGEIVD